MAAGDSLCLITPAVGELPTSSYPSYNVKNGALILEFDADSDESVEFSAFMPRHYGGGDIIVTIGWMADTATTNNCIWAVAFKSITDDVDSMSKSFAAVQTVTAAASSPAGEVFYDTITFTNAQADSVAAGEFFRLKLTRDADNGSDNMAGDAHLLFIELQDNT